MFYSETLLSKTGPLARVWLAANIERKLTKKDVLSSGIERSVHAIVDQGQAPMALRLSGQLLLGVVRIYSRKARYLLDDCNEALLKIKMAFKPGNVDLPAHQTHSASAAALTLPDVLTELDLMAPMPDPELLLADLDPTTAPRQQDPTLLDWGSSQLLTESLSTSFQFDQPLALEDDDLGLDITDIPADTTLMSVEHGRRAPSLAPHGLDDEFALGLPEEPAKLLEDDGLELDLGDDLPPLDGDTTFMAPGVDDGLDLPPLVDVPTSPMSMEAPTPAPPVEEAARIRDSVSPPLSSIHSSEDRELAGMFLPDTPAATEGEDGAVSRPRPKRRRILQADETTEMTTKQIRNQTMNRDSILRPMTFLPRNPLMLSLMQHHRDGSVASLLIGDARMTSWAPELRDIFSAAALRQTGELKRKRTSDASDISIVPSLEFDDGRPEHAASEIFDIPVGDDSEMLDLPRASAEPGRTPAAVVGEEDDVPQLDFSDEEPLTPVHEREDTFDETTIPILHPADSGPIAMATKRVVHELRDRFGSYTSSPADQTIISFTDLAPEGMATKVDATKMFFEMLVLATKDAIKVEQPTADESDRFQVGGPIRIRAKRGLWGSWAEEGAAGGLDNEQEEQERERAMSKVPESATVSVVPLSPQAV